MNKTAWLFPGQASQKVGMGKDIYDKIPSAKEYFDIANEIMNNDIKSVIFEGPEEILKKTEFTQPAIYIVSVIIGKILVERGFEPDYLAGHSLGEYSACTIGGCFDFETGLNLVKTRADSMSKASSKVKGKMAAIIGIEIDALERLCSAQYPSREVVVANYNAPGQFVISGTESSVNHIMTAAKDSGAKLTIELNVSGAFHSPLMSPAREELAELINSLEISDSIYPVFSNVDSKPKVKNQEIKKSLIRQLESPVQWISSILNMKEYGASNFFEIGPGNVLRGLNKRIDKTIITKGVSVYQDMERIFVQP